MRRYIKLYTLLAGAYVRSRLQYRLSFGFMCFGIVISEVCLLGLLGALLAKFRTVNGWTWAEVVFLYGLGNLAYSLMRILGSQLDDFDRYIVRGELDGVLIKPVAPLFYILASRVELVHVSRALTSVCYLRCRVPLDGDSLDGGGCVVHAHDYFEWYTDYAYAHVSQCHRCTLDDEIG